MELWELLGIRPGLTAVIGSGGKTSLLRVLAQELSHRGTVLVSTTTRIMRPNWCPFAATAAELCDGFAYSPIVCAGSYNPEGKLTAPDFPRLAVRRGLCAGWRPTAPSACPPRPTPPGSSTHPERNRTVCVFGASALGQPIQDAAHRPELYASLAEVSPEAVITPAIAARVLAKEGGFDVLFINQADVLEDPPQRCSPSRMCSLPGSVWLTGGGVLGEIVTDQEQEAPMPLDKLCIVFIFFALQCGGILRSGIEDAYQFKMSHREIRQYDKTRSLWYRILLPYSHMKYCGAPRHMRLFQTLRALNLAAIIAMLVLAYIFPPTHSITLFAYFFIGAYFVLLYIPLLCYSIYMSNWPKGPKGWNFSKSKRP